MKKNRKTNANGITICDSIVMSVRKKRHDFRFPLALFIAVCGFTAVIMSFLGMFHLVYDRKSLMLAAVGFSAFYIMLTVLNRKALWVYAASAVVFAGVAYKKLGTIVEGFKFTYNVIYEQTYHTNTAYYNNLSAKNEKAAVTTMLIFAVWMLAIVIYYFTICRPNPILPLMITFPIIEIGLYNGIKMPIFWGMLTIAYWLALFAMSTIDVGEYTGGSGGFVRKDDLFFPKRKMKLKVTERCGVFIIAAVMIITGITSAYIKASDYERSDKINQKRVDISDAFSAFTMDDFFGSLARVAAAFGFNVKIDSNKLGANDSIEYDNETDLIVTFSDVCDGAVYLKENNSAIYEDNEWKSLSDGVYDNDNYKKAVRSMYPQEFYGRFASYIYPEKNDTRITVEPQMKRKRFFTPYSTVYGGLDFIDDTIAETDDLDKQQYRVRYASSSAIIRSLAQGDSSITTYSEYNEGNRAVSSGGFRRLLNDHPESYDVQSAEKYYREFVYENYLQVPDTHDMHRLAFQYLGSERFRTARKDAQSCIDVLNSIKEQMSNTCTYTLSPGKTPYSEDFVSYFLLKNQRGYCVHFATAGVLLARMAGIPARYASGYVVVEDDFKNAQRNNMGSYVLSVKDNRSHAWTEVYLDGFGWVPFDFTTGYGEHSIDPGNKSPKTPNDPPATTAPSGTLPATTTVTTTTRSSGGGGQLTTTTSISGTSPSGAVKGSTDNSSSHKGLSKTAKTVLISVALVLLVIAAFLLRRRYIIEKRSDSFTKGSAGDRMTAVYAYTDKLLAALHTEIGEMNYIEYADEVEQKFGGRYFNNGDFRLIMDTALCAAFSGSGPDEDAVKKCSSIAEKFARKLYADSGFFRKLLLKYVDVII